MNLIPASPVGPAEFAAPKIIAAQGDTRLRVSLLQGCAQCALRPNINDAAVRLLSRAGCEVVLSPSIQCCGALLHHLGRENSSKEMARRNVDGWSLETEGDGLDAIVATASGCGTMIKDYAHLFKENSNYAERAEMVSAIARDVSEILLATGLPAAGAVNLPKVAHHAACSLYHGQGVTTAPRSLLVEAGFELLEEPTIVRCCGSAGTYNLLHPKLADLMRDQRLAAPDISGAEVIATDNIGCLTQLASNTSKPVVHSVELLDWATGGARPPGI